MSETIPCCWDIVMRVTDCSPKASLLGFYFAFSVSHSCHWDSVLVSSVPGSHVACMHGEPQRLACCSALGPSNCLCITWVWTFYEIDSTFQGRLFQTLMSPPLQSLSDTSGEFGNLPSLHLDQGSLCGLLCVPSLIPATTANGEQS